MIIRLKQSNCREMLQESKEKLEWLLTERESRALHNVELGDHSNWLCRVSQNRGIFQNGFTQRSGCAQESENHIWSGHVCQFLPISHIFFPNHAGFKMQRERSWHTTWMQSNTYSRHKHLDLLISCCKIYYWCFMRSRLT